ncbi:MAG TPA: PRC and DUF2382 domain-containing protein [Solirubrobacterales bacterium]|nr:PRC and DUF2382 domain-containing protein [Solirubrobacterales bacterium]
MNAPTGMTNAYEWRDRTVVGSDGEKIGTVDEVYLDTESGEPEWLSVNTGLFGVKSSFVPLQNAQPAGEDVRVAYTKDEVKDAPGIKPDEELSDAEERELWGYYGLEYGSNGVADDAREPVGRDTSGPETDDAMTRSEEELRVGTREREGGRARLRKYVVTENVTQTVPVRKEKAVLEREPITEGNVDQALDGPAISDEEHEVVLSEEEVVVEKKAVPKERVRLGKETVTGEEQVSEEVRKERIEAEGEIQR